MSQFKKFTKRLKYMAYGVAVAAAVVGYGEYTGSLDVRYYSTSEIAYQARLQQARSILVRESMSADDGSHNAPANAVHSHARKAQATEGTVWVAVDGEK